MAKIVTELIGHMEALQRISVDNRNTKVEIKEIAERASTLATKLKADPMRRVWEHTDEHWIQPRAPCSPNEQGAEEIESLRRENARLRKEVEAAKKAKEVETACNATQTEAGQKRKAAQFNNKEELLGAIAKTREEGCPIDSLKDIIAARWPKEAFKSTEECCPVAELEEEWDVVAMVTADFNMDQGTLQELRERYRGIDELKGQRLEPGDCTKLTDSIRLQGRDGKITVHTRNVHYGIVGKRAMDPPNLNHLLTCLKAVKVAVTSGEKKSIALSAGGNCNPETFRKVVECVFYDAPGISLKVLQGKDEFRQSRQTPQTRGTRQRD